MNIGQIKRAEMTHSGWSETGDASLSLFFKFALEYISKKIQVNQEGLKLNEKYQIVVYTYDVNLLGENLHTREKKHTEAVLMATKENGLEISTEQTKYRFMSRKKLKDKVTTER
jgi:hypothetical protein